jgi:GntR family transcriptional regulator
MLKVPARYAAATDASLPLPRYHQIYLVLREQIADGRFDGGEPLPGEVELAARFGVSRVTVRAALDRLAEEGLILRQRGRGTFARRVSTPAPARADLSGLLENLMSMGLKTTVRLIEATLLPASAEVAGLLGMAPGSPVQKAIRVRGYRNAPFSHITTFVPEAIAKSFGRKELQSKPMLQLLEEAGVQVSSADQTISARLADHAVAPLLDVDLGAPLLAVTRVVRDQQQRAVQLLRGLYRPDRYEYQMHLTRSEGDTPRVWVNDDHRSPSPREKAP